jgi:hypothetical protein
MITKLQTVFGKHHKYILTALLAVLIVAFVFTIGAVPHGQAGAQSAAPRMMLGVNVNDRETVTALQKATAYSLAWQLRQARTNEEMQQALFGRIALLYLADQWQVPNPTDAQKKAYVQTLAYFKNADGEFDPAKYQRFLDGVQTNPNLLADRELIAQTLAENCRMDEVIKIVSGPGYALPFSAEIQASFRGTTWNMEVAALDLGNFTPTLTANETVLQALYNHDPSKYAVPMQVRMSYATFAGPPSTMTPTAAQLKDFVAANPKDFPDAKPDNLDAANTTAATTAWQKAQGAQEAGQQAQNFVKALYDNSITRGTPAFDALVQKAGVKLATLPPVTVGKVAADSPVPDEALQQAAQTLNAQHYYSDPVRLADGAAVLFYEDATPAHTPPFAEARTAVLSDYTELEKVKQFEAHGKEVQLALTKAMAGGENFKVAATALGLTVKDYPAVNFTDPPADLSYQLLGSLATPDASGVPTILAMQPNKVGPMLVTDNGGAFVNVLQRNTPKLNADSPDTQKSLKAMEVQESELSADAIIGPVIQKAVRQLQQGD